MYVCKDNAFVRLAVFVCILKDHEAVVHRLTRLPLRISVPGCDPQSSLGVDLHLNGICQIRKLFFRCKDVELMLSDVDGVLTDGGIIFDNQGIEIKRFHVRDGFGIHLWQRAGFKFGILTARTSHIVKVRANELGVDLVRQGFEDKLPAARQVIEELGIDASQVCYIGDDLPDLPVIAAVGLGVAVSDATEELRSAADYVSALPGGQGAVREVIEVVLKAKGLWDELSRRCTAM